jgi:hypothetical protein
MATEPDWLEKWAYTARWFVLPISFAGWIVARILALVFGVGTYGQPNGYVHILLISVNYDRHDFVPPWLAYFYNGVSVLMIVCIVLIAIHRMVTEDGPQP